MAIKVESFKADTILNIKVDKNVEGVRRWNSNLDSKTEKTERGIKANNIKVGNFLPISLGLQKHFIYYYISLHCKCSLHVITTFWASHNILQNIPYNFKYGHKQRNLKKQILRSIWSQQSFHSFFLWSPMKILRQNIFCIIFAYVYFISE